MTKRIKHKIIDGIECKRCSTCQAYKALKYFSASMGSWDRLGSICRACDRARVAAYYENNKEARIAYYENNKEACKATQRAYRENNKEACKATQRAYHKNNKEACKATQRAYHKNNKEACKATQRAYYKSSALYETWAHQLVPCEEVRKERGGLLMVRCAYCGQWLAPSCLAVQNRCIAINTTNRGEHRFYCSDQCKQECPIYNQVTYYKGQHGKQGTSREVQPELRQLVFERDNWTCQKCGSKESLHCHHITGVELNPIESADIDNCCTFCKTCHRAVHQQKGCTYFDFRRKPC